jgi:hypothetical protein
MTVQLFEIDVTSDVLPQGADTAQQGLDQVLARVIDYQLADARGIYSPFLSNGYLGSINWRDLDIVEQNTTAGRNFSGQIRNVGTRYENGSYTTSIQAIDNVAAFLDSNVLVGTTASATTTNTGNANSNTIHLTSGAFQKNDIIYFGNKIVPQFRITAVHSATATLDRNLGIDVVNGTTYYYTRPVSKTPSELIYDALLPVIGDASRFGSTFASFNALDSGNTITVFLTQADGVSLREYLNQLLILGAFQITVNDSGVIDIARNRNWDGSSIAEQFTPDEIIGPYQITFDTSATYEAFQVPYVNSTGEVEINTSSVNADSTVIATYKNRGVFSPLPISTGESAQYNIIFSSEPSASYYLAIYKANYSYPRIVIQCSAKAFPSGKPGSPFEVILGKPFLVSIPLGIGENFIQEPAVVTGYTIQRETQLLQSVTLMLTNRLNPNTTRTIDTQPTLTSATGPGGSKLRIVSSSGTYQVQVRHKFTKEIVYDNEVLCPADISISAPLSEYQVRLISPSKLYKTEFKDFTLT